ncbi:hypothetical protein RCG23_13875 [Neobacillus sp. PS3-34]|uniref:hypothetical protein n=1 Tax=Neobacillus sp. PS3-34 TaxID=3070678 RepID=UPI0027DF5FFE|nr:hypothetical protein [Neobacillus sp. PS3-34]WML46731.1 hypothetical protein RCG23_13875 [Neobacillus sp. PS3-34]
MNKEFSNKSTGTSMVFGIVFGIMGISCLSFFPLLGLGFIAIGVIVFFLIRTFMNNTTVTIHDQGFSVKEGNKRKGTAVKEYKWSDVVATSYYEEDSGGEDSDTTSFFQVSTNEGVAFDLQKMKGFNELIELVNQNTPHLPYYWAKPQGWLGKYQKQSRG